MQARVPLRNLRRLTVGKGSYVAPTAELGLHAEIRIGSGVVINAGAKLLTGSHNTRSPLWELVSRPIVVGDHAWVAVNAMILPGVRIGRAAVVGAGAVVSRDVPDFAVVAGNPAREVGRRGPGPFRYWGSSSVAAFEAWLGPDPELSLHHD
jgi:acetyltransferase-like isoleucine patch superfamily enzyme